MTILDLGAGIYTTAAAEIGDPVQKAGQTTGYTTGVVVETDMLNYAFPQPITPGNFEPVVICDNILVQASPGTPPPGVISDGDSGSVLFGFNTAEGATIHPAVGLVWAQADGNLVACKIQRVFSELDLDVLCASGFPAYLDGLAAEDAPEFTAGVNFVGADRSRRSAALPSAGLARSVEARLVTGKHGKRLVRLVRKHRHELTQQLIRQGDLRRAAPPVGRDLARACATCRPSTSSSPPPRAALPRWCSSATGARCRPRPARHGAQGAGPDLARCPNQR